MINTQQDPTARAEWLEARKTGIGASEAAAAIGVSPWSSPMQLWGEKTGRIEPDDLSEVERVQWGTILEPIIGEEYSRRTGRHVGHNAAYEIVRHPNHDCMQATLDFRQHADDHAGPGVLETKTTSEWNKADWQGEPPLHYQIQLQHQLACTDHSWGTLAALVGGQELFWIDFERNDRFIAAMIEAEARFWDHVTSDTPPPVDGSIVTADALRQLYGKDDGETIALPAESIVWDEKLVEVKAYIKELKADQVALENNLKAAMQDAAYGRLPNGGRYSWKTITRHEQAREARETQYRQFRRMKK